MEDIVHIRNRMSAGFGAAQIALNDLNIMVQILKIGPIAGAKVIKDADRMACITEMADKICPDKSCPTGD